METENIKIKNYEPSDAQDLANIYYHTIHQINIRDYTERQIDVWAPQTSLDAERWKEKFEKTKPLVAFAEGQIVGFAEFKPDGHIDCFYCHHEWIGCGVGAALMNAILEEAEKQGIKHIFADVSITAKPFFERCGFTAVEEQQVKLGEVLLKNTKMERLL